MSDKRKSKVFLLLCACVVSAGSSKCPETRKPHVTSCTIFYNCINLPEDGYVWAPAKCSEGLVFQPYLRICVLPGDDAWTCDNASSEKILPNEKPQLIDPTKTSYHGYKQDSTFPSESPLHDSTNKLDDNSELGNLGSLVTAYPLIEAISDKEESKVSATKMKNSMSRSCERAMENYLHRFFRIEEILRTRLVSGNNDDEKNKFTWLRQIIDGIMLYENYENSRTSVSCETSLVNNFKKKDRYDELSSDTLHYLAQNYIFGMRNPTREKLQKKKKKKRNRKTTTERIEESEDGAVATTASTHRDDPIVALIDETKTEQNIVVIEGNLGDREYITVDKYKSLASHAKLRVIEILPCAKGVRLANLTDCTRYYTCDPETARIVKFSCSPRTAFNDYNRICDIQRYKACARQQDVKNEETTTNNFTMESTTTLIDYTEIPENNEPCRNTGKFVDSISDKHYYVCYSSQANPSKIESLRMTCPNDLIFCQEKRVCSTRKRCYES